MTYVDQGNLAADGTFNLRLTACTTEQAGTFVNDGRPDIAHLAREILGNAAYSGWFTWPVATAPGFGDAYAEGGQEAIDDAQLLSAVQTLWPTIAAAHPAEATP